MSTTTYTSPDRGALNALAQRCLADALWPFGIQVPPSAVEQFVDNWVDRVGVSAPVQDAEAA